MYEEVDRLKQPKIGQLIYLLRKQLNLTQEEFSRHLCVSFATINRWERGKNHPSQMALKEIKYQLQSLDEAGLDLLSLVL
jgi:putative transcriptional regulator